jgi:glutamyl-tRNA reductase
MITGEPQVLGQVKESHRVARVAGACGPTLDAVLDAAYHVAKRVRTETAIGERPVSITAAAERLARNIHGDLSHCAGLLVGDGDMGELIAAHLRRPERQGAGLGALTVTARIEARAEMLSRHMGCNYAPFERLDRLLADADIVISALATGRRALTREQVAAALAARRRKPIFLIDAAVPGDIERSVNDLDGAFVYDLAELEAVAIEGRAGRDAAAAEASCMVEEAVEDFCRDRAGRRAGPAVARLRARFEEVRAAALRDAGGDAEAATRLLVNRLLHEPSAALRALAESGSADGADAERLLIRLFDLDRADPDDRDAGDEETKR